MTAHLRPLLLPTVILLGAGALGMTLFPRAAPIVEYPLKRTAEHAVSDALNSTGASVPVPQFLVETDGETTSASALPERVRIAVPFLVQAPLGNWNMPYQEACEEASLISVHHFLEGTPVTPEEADREINALIDWENAQFNYSADITIAEAKRVAEDYYRYWGEVFYDFTIEDMKRLLAAGHPLILPLAGRDLGNPYYNGEGPWYHMLVVTGYDRTHFLTNDVGTRRGEGYRYTQQRLFNAIHDWTGVKEDIRSGKKAMLVLSKR